MPKKQNLGDFIEARLSTLSRLRYTRTLLIRLKIKNKSIENSVLDRLAYVEGVINNLTMADTNFK